MHAALAPLTVAPERIPSAWTASKGATSPGPRRAAMAFATVATRSPSAVRAELATLLARVRELRDDLELMPATAALGLAQWTAADEARAAAELARALRRIPQLRQELAARDATARDLAAAATVTPLAAPVQASKVARQLEPSLPDSPLADTPRRARLARLATTCTTIAAQLAPARVVAPGAPQVRA